MFSRELSHPTCGRMHSQQEIIEREPATDGNHDFPIDYELLRFDLVEVSNQVRKIPGQRPTRFRLEINIATVAENEAAKPVPFWFVLPLLPDRRFFHRQSLHRRQWRLQSKCHYGGTPFWLSAGGDFSPLLVKFSSFDGRMSAFNTAR